MGAEGCFCLSPRHFGRPKEVGRSVGWRKIPIALRIPPTWGFERYACFRQLSSSTVFAAYIGGVKRTSTAHIAFTVAAPRLARVLLVLLLAVAVKPERSLSATPIAEGEAWLKWSDETRVAYVSAYFWGHARGFRDGCEAAERISAGGKLKRPCTAEPPVYSKILEDYAGMVTEFYRSYSTDRSVPIFQLLDGMSDKRNLTIQQMHEYFGDSAKRSQ